METIQFSCPGCAKALRAPVGTEGRQAKCKCGLTVTVPRANAPSSSATYPYTFSQGTSNSTPIATRILKRTNSDKHFSAYRAALEWDLADPIVIESAEDLKSTIFWQGKIEPYQHQVTNLMTFCRRLPVTLLADDVGLGKTISAGLIISELMSRSRASTVLIVCPKLLGPQWKDELAVKFGIASKVAIGKDLLSADPGEKGAVITTYNTARLHLNSIPQDRFQMLILDEAHKLRNLYGVEKPPQVAKCFRAALEERRFRFILMLTATPIQNRLWDIYSLVDLLAVARGHQNPFGTDGLFARKFIADKRESARQLKPEARDEFRRIVYDYMSRVRRADAGLYFPSRVVQMHRVDPTPAEKELIQTIAEPIQSMNPLVQISILQALTSSPDALRSQLKNMAKNGTAPAWLAQAVDAIVVKMPLSAKLQGLSSLVDRLRRENPHHWRMVVFTGRRETQTTIQLYLESRGLIVGVINGSSGQRNQETISRFRQNPPKLNVIVSTEAGSEGVNLQAANVLVNYDLPWNPMIVEQRIGRIQRLASQHASVAIFNIMLRGTFEEYIVGRLLEKLQMAASAIGDIEALLGGAGIAEDEDSGSRFEERIRELVVAALAGKDTESALRLEEESIDRAKADFEREREAMDTLLGSANGEGYTGPRAPTLPRMVRSMDVEAFTIASLSVLGATIKPQRPGVFLVTENGQDQLIRCGEDAEASLMETMYAPGSPAFLRLVSRMIAVGLHDVVDADEHSEQRAHDVARKWVAQFRGSLTNIELCEVERCFEGCALVRARATVAHDTYERLVAVKCPSSEHRRATDRSGLSPIGSTIDTPSALGLDLGRLAGQAKLDEALTEFSRFYLERRDHELRAAANDSRKQKKLSDEFTPRLEMTLVSLEGTVHRKLKLRLRYCIDGATEYESAISVLPHAQKIANQPEFGMCRATNTSVPRECLGRCDISNSMVLRHRLVHSDLTHRTALPEHTLICGLSGKRILKDEAKLSSMSGKFVAASLLKTSAVSGKCAEPSYFGRCEFTGSDALVSELGESELSHRRFRLDQGSRSAMSGKLGHQSEFVVCHVTRESIAQSESERCELTGKTVRIGILENCSKTNKRVLGSELQTCAVTKKRALRSLFVTSSISGSHLLPEAAIQSMAGKVCAINEAKSCGWSGGQFHPDDLCECKLTGMRIHRNLADLARGCVLRPLIEMLDGKVSSFDESLTWEAIAAQFATAIGKPKCRVESAMLSPSKRYLAICLEVRKWFGFQVDRYGLIYDAKNRMFVGRGSMGKRGPHGWSLAVE